MPIAIDHAADICHVVGDRPFAILARHPARDDLLVVPRIEAMQRLRRDDAPARDARNQCRTSANDVVGRLSVAVQNDDEAG